MSARNVLFLASGTNVPTTRYRIMPFIPHLRARGVRCDVAVSWPEKYGSFRLVGWRASQKLKRATRHWHRLVASWKRYDVIVIEREIFDDPTWDLEKRFRDATPRMILDVDDAIFLRYPEKFAATARLCDAVVAGNALLAEKASEYCPDVTVIPTCIEPEDFPPRELARPEHTPVIGWIGTPSNLPYLKEIADPLRRLAGEQRYQLRIVTDIAEARRLGENPLEDLPVDWQPWSADSAASEIARFDIGIMPLPDNDWTRYKCGFKLLQYMAAGVPPVGSPVGVNREILEDGVSGFLPASRDDWHRALSRLVAEPELRRSIGERARKRAADQYSVRGHVDVWWNTLFPPP